MTFSRKIKIFSGQLQKLLQVQAKKLLDKLSLQKKQEKIFWSHLYNQRFSNG